MTARSLLLACIVLLACGLGPPSPAAAQAGSEEMVVMVRAKTEDGREMIGGGIVFGTADDAIYIATARHVVADGAYMSTAITAEFLQRRGMPVEARPTTTRFSQDLAVIVVRDDKLAARLRRDLDWSRAVLDHDELTWKKAYIVGFAKGQVWSRSPQPESITSARSTEIEVDSRFVARGHSGGGVFDENWRLIGMVWADEPPLAKVYPLRLVLEEVDRSRFPVAFPLRDQPAPRPAPAQPRPRLSPISPPSTSVPASALPRLGDLMGAWRGRYAYTTYRGGVPVDFAMTLAIVDNGCRGRIEEPNTFGDRAARNLYATVVCQVDITKLPARLIFKKTYDGTGRVSHSVDYSGDISPDGRSVKGIWRIGNEYGTFELVR
jgi:hypothetical protein